MNVESVSVNDKTFGVLSIKFKSVANIRSGDVVSIDLNGVPKYFKVNNIEVVPPRRLMCTATGYGYGRDVVEELDVADIRDLIDLKVTKVDDYDKIKELEKRNRYC